MVPYPTDPLGSGTPSGTHSNRPAHLSFQTPSSAPYTDLNSLWRSQPPLDPIAVWRNLIANVASYPLPDPLGSGTLSHLRVLRALSFIMSTTRNDLLCP